MAFTTTLKNSLILSIFLFIGGVGLAPTPTHADPPSVNAGPINIRGLQYYSGQDVTLLYSSGAAGSIGVMGQLPNLKLVLAASTHTIPPNGEVYFEAQTIPLGPKGEVFNYLVVVVHEQPEFFYFNPNGGAPLDARLSGGAVPTDRDLASNLIRSYPWLTLKSPHNPKGEIVIDLSTGH